MGTDIGIPRPFPRPEPCCATSHSVTIFWFADNPRTFGGASTLFEIRCCGEGRSWPSSDAADDGDCFQIQRFTLDDAVVRGKEVLALMQEEYDGAS